MVALEVGDVGHGGFGETRRRRVAMVARRRWIVVERIFLVNDQEAGLCLVGEFMAGDRDGAVGDPAFVCQVPWIVVLIFVFVIGRSIGLRALVLGSLACTRPALESSVAPEREDSGEMAAVHAEASTLQKLRCPHYRSG